MFRMWSALCTMMGWHHLLGDRAYVDTVISNFKSYILLGGHFSTSTTHVQGYWLVLEQAYIIWTPCRLKYTSKYSRLSSSHSNQLLIFPHPDSKVHGAIMGPVRGRQDPDEPHVGPMIIAIWAAL